MSSVLPAGTAMPLRIMEVDEVFPEIAESRSVKVQPLEASTLAMPGDAAGATEGLATLLTLFKLVSSTATELVYGRAVVASTAESDVIELPDSRLCLEELVVA